MLACPALVSAQYDINDGAWEITYNTSSKMLTYNQNGKDLLRGVYVEIHDANGQTLQSNSYPSVSLTEEAVSDAFGSGTKYTYTYSGLAGKDNIEQNIYIYPDKNYILVDAALVAASGTTKTNYIAPIVTRTTTELLPQGGENYIYDMPFDNDNWVGYSARPWNITQGNPSCEVSAMYDVISRNGLIVGSIEHDNWKSGITVTPTGQNRVRNLTVAAGVVNSRTNDVNDGVHEGRPSIYQHGSISGSKVYSPRYFFGFYDDWRTGLEELGNATATLAPKMEWNNGSIFAFNSWGGLAEHVNYEGLISVCDFYADQLVPNNFHNENGVCYIVIDSYWNYISDENLGKFVEYCKAHNLRPGVYHSPFAYWGDEQQALSQHPDGVTDYVYADMALRANGQMRKIASIALDPTHPGTLQYNKYIFDKFKRLGFEYVKVDFLNNGALEADSYYEKSVTTGMQAYTYGMKKVLEYADGLFIDLSIAPVFPAMGHARRIACDHAGGFEFTKYTLNSLNMGWWLDRVYQYNDPDYVVFKNLADDGEKRMRYTNCVISGFVILGDNLSLAGSYPGTQTERDNALKFSTNPEVNAVGRLGRSFRPVEGRLTDGEGNVYGLPYGVDREFVLDTDDAFYYVVFNYDKDADFTKTADFSRIGVDAADVKSIKELWTGQSVSFSGNGFEVSVPKGDVCLYRLDKTTSGINEITGGETDDVNITYNGGSITVKASEAVTSVQVYDMQGVLMSQVSLDGDNTEATVGLDCANGLYIAKATMKSGRSAVRKIMVK